MTLLVGFKESFHRELSQRYEPVYQCKRVLEPLASVLKGERTRSHILPQRARDLSVLQIGRDHLSSVPDAFVKNFAAVGHIHNDLQRRACVQNDGINGYHGQPLLTRQETESPWVSSVSPSPGCAPRSLRAAPPVVSERADLRLVVQHTKGHLP